MRSRSRCGPAIDSIARRYGAAVKVAEIPPGPPVLSTLVAEVYAADDSTRLAAAAQVKHGRSRRRPAWSTWTGRSRRRSSARRFRVDRVRAAAARARASSRSRRRCTWRSPARRAASRASATAREAMAIVPRLAARAALVDRGAARAADRDGDRARSRSARFVTVLRFDARERPRAKGSAAGDLRDGRRRRRDRVAGVRDAGDEQEARRRFA